MPLPIFRPTLEERKYISFSEAYVFSKCPHQHWTKYREKRPSEATIHTEFGKAIGAAIEQYKKNNVKNAWISIGKAIFRYIIDGEWGDYVKEEEKDWRIWTKIGFRIFKDTLEWMDKTYPGWELIDFEYELFEPIEGSTKKFKGFIDLIFKYKDKIYIFDFKTCSWGWGKDKRENTHKLYQVILYKYYYCKKNNIDPKDVVCAYLLLKRKPAKKETTSVELFEQTSGLVKLNNSVKWLNEQAEGIDRGVRIKKKDTCEFCVCGAADDAKRFAKTK